MGMLGTLAKVAVGIAVAKGVGGMLKGSGGNGGLLGGGGATPSGGAPSSRGGGLEDLIGDVLSGGRRSGGSGTGGGGPTGGLGDLLEQLGGGALGKSGGGLGDLIGGLAGGQTRGGSELENIFGEFLGAKKAQDTSGGSFGDIFNEAIARGGEPEAQPSREQEAAAALMLRAMIQAAKSDGEIDAGEEAKLMDNLGDVSAEERDFVNRELRAPVDAAGLAAQVPAGMESQVYLMSIMGIDLDNRKEAEYLHELAGHLDLDQDTVNGIHDHLGVARLYR